MNRKAFLLVAIVGGLSVIVWTQFRHSTTASAIRSEDPGARSLESGSPASAILQDSAQEELEAELRSFTPQHLIAKARFIGDGAGNPLGIDILFSRADLDGTGEFRFIVALYIIEEDGAAVRVFREVEGQLQLAGDHDPSIEVGGSRPKLELVDVDNDGIPEISVIGYGMRTHYGFEVFQWTGDSLRHLTAQGGTGDAALEDVDEDGVLEILRPPDCSAVKPTQPLSDCIGPYRVYKFNGSEFQLAFTSPADPTGTISPTGDNLTVFGDRALMSPPSFPLAAIRQANQPGAPQGGVVTVRLGNLSGAEQGARFDVKDIDLTRLRLDRTIAPQRTQILPASAQEKCQGEPGGFQGDFLQAEFDRGEVLRFLPRTQLNKPLEAGDKLTLELRGKMRNGAPLHTSVTVEIQGN